MKMTLVILSTVAIAGLICAGCAAVRAGYESAPFRVARSDGKFELRDYPALVVAETPMRGADGSFMRLFHFISGENSAKEKISMTTHEQTRPQILLDSLGTALKSFCMRGQQ